MINTPNIGLSLDTLGYVRFRQAYVRNMREIEIQTGLRLPTNVIGEVLFRRNVRDNLAKIAVHLGMPASPQFSNNDELRRVVKAAIMRIDGIIGGSAPLIIGGTPSTNGQVGTPYSFTPSTGGGRGTKVFSLAGGTLLAGLTLNTTTGAITGTPTAAGSMTGLSVRVIDDAGNAATIPTTVTIAPSEVTFDPTVLRSGQQYTFTARRMKNLTQAETCLLRLAPSISYLPAAIEAELAGLTATASFAANSATAPAAFTVPATVHPE